MAREDIHPVDQVLSVAKLVTLGLQHVLVVYAGAVAVPLILGRALKLAPEDVAFLISADLFTCGLSMLLLGVRFPGASMRPAPVTGVTSPRSIRRRQWRCPSICKAFPQYA